MIMMDSPAFLAAQHMALNRINQDKIANNIANNTAGFQADLPIVASYDPNKSTLDSLSFAVSGSRFRDITVGELNHTDSAFDIAVNTPDVYLAVQDPNGQNLYTRNGHLELNQDRQLIQSASGFPLADTNHGPIVIPAGTHDINIAEDGTITADGKIVAKIGTFQFANSQTLIKTGRTLMKASVEPTAADKASITQRAIESSNVNPVIALAQMIELQRQDAQDAFVISTYKDQTGQQIADLLKPLNV